MVVIVTFVADAYVPAAGATVGVATFISYAALATALSGMPGFHAFAFKVCVWLTTMLPPAATMESASVGSWPFCV
jgi:hypothetical protein